MPNQRNLSMAAGDVVACRVLRQRNNTQIYLPRAAVRYLGVAPGDTIYVTAGPNGVCVSRAELPAGQAAVLQSAARVLVSQAVPVSAPTANPAAAQIASLQAQINQIAISLGQPSAPAAVVPIAQAIAAELQTEVRRYRRQRSKS